MRAKKTKATSVRFDGDTDKMIGLLAKRMGFKRSQVLKMAVRELAKKEGLR